MWTQFFQVETGKGEVWIEGVHAKIEGDTAIIVHTLYAPPEHVDGTVHGTKGDAQTTE